MITITVVGSGMKRLEEAARILGTPGRARKAYSRAINHTGRVVGNEAGRVLSDQTGLPKSTGKRAMRRMVDRSTPATLMYTINGSGGEISLRYFKPRETQKGVSAAPWNKRQVFPSTFMKAGWWPTRVGKPEWNRQVFERITSDGYGRARIGDKLVRTGTKFRKVKSGMFIPIEMVQGVTAEAWRKGAQRLQPRVEHEVRVMSKGVVS